MTPKRTFTAAEMRALIQRLDEHELWNRVAHRHQIDQRASRWASQPAGKAQD